MLFLLALDPAPSDNAVKAGWTAFAVFLLLIGATVFLLWNMNKQLKDRKVKLEVTAAAKEAIISEGYDPDHSPLGCPVYWRIVNRGWVAHSSSRSSTS